MATINKSFNEIACKIVYYGPGLCGKTTNLEFIHSRVPKKFAGELVSLATETDRTLFFDFLPINVGDVHGMKTKFQLFTVPGQVFYNATRRLVLRGVDGIVFVADSQRERLDDNRESLLNLRENLAEYGCDLESIPWILQYNKRDLPNAMAKEELESALNPGVPTFDAVAFKGDGVDETLKFICVQVLKKLRNQMETETSDLEKRANKNSAPAPVVSKPIVSDEGDIPLPSKAALMGQGIEVPEDYPDQPSGIGTAPEPEKVEPEKKEEAPIKIMQKCDVHWLGIKIGSARVEFKSLGGSNGDRRYQLDGEVKTFGFIRQPCMHTLKKEGEEWLSMEARDVPFMVFSPDANGHAIGDHADTEDIKVYVKNAMDRSLFFEQKGFAGGLRFSPSGKATIF